MEGVRPEVPGRLDHRGQGHEARPVRRLRQLGDGIEGPRPHLRAGQRPRRDAGPGRVGGPRRPRQGHRRRRAAPSRQPVDAPGDRRAARHAEVEVEAEGRRPRPPARDGAVGGRGAAGDPGRRREAESSRSGTGGRPTLGTERRAPAVRRRRAGREARRAGGACGRAGGSGRTRAEVSRGRGRRGAGAPRRTEPEPAEPAAAAEPAAETPRRTTSRSRRSSRT